jgi:cytochrome c-type biogenesis protein CcmH/NrfF
MPPRRLSESWHGPRARAQASRVPAVAALALAALIFAGASSAPLAAELSPQEQVETRLMCYCGCSDLTVRTCSCGTAADIKQDIARRLADGQTADQVVEAYVRERGPQIRSAPTTSGFDLLAWVTPFVVILAGGGFIVHLTRRWRCHATQPAAHGGMAAPAFDSRRLSADDRGALDRIEREIREEL